MRTLLAACLVLSVAAPASPVERGHRERRHSHHYHGKRHCAEKHERRGAMLVATGRYKGDGVSGHRITESDAGAIDFKGAVLIIRRRTLGFDARVWIDTMEPGAAIDDATAIVYDAILSVDNTGFTLGSSINTNENGKVYEWLMLGKNTSRGGRDLVTGKYTGNATNDRSISVGFQNPTVLPLIVGVGSGQTNDPFCIRDNLYSGDSSSFLVFQNATATNRIQGFAADSFEVGDDTDVNENGDTYYWFAIADDGKDTSVAVLEWEGNSTDDTDITGTSVEPTAVLIRGIDNAGRSSIISYDGPADDYGLNSSLGPVRYVKAFNSDGITLSDDSNVNNTGETYHGWFFSTVGQSAGGRLSTPLRDALRDDPKGAKWLVDVAFPDATRLYAMEGIASESEGQYQAKALSIGPIPLEISDERGGQVKSFTVAVEVEDSDRDLSQLLTGEYADQIRLTPPTARIRLGAAGVAPGDWFTAFSGELSNWNFPRSYVTGLVFRPPDRLLRRSFPNSAWVISRADHPGAADAIIGRIAPLIYGSHQSPNHTAKGFVPLLLIDPSEPRYLVCAGRASDVTKVYVDTVENTGASFEYVTINGKWYTTVVFSSSPGDVEEISVTADVDGYESNGDGTSGTLITNPATQLAHLLSNFVYGDWRSGSWLSTDAVMDTEHLATAEDFLEARSYAGSRRISTLTNGRDLLAEWAVSHEARVWWTGEGKLAIGFEDPTAALEYQQVPWLHQSGDFLDEPTVENDDSQLITRLTANYVKDESGADGDYVYSLTIEEPYQPEFLESIDFPWSDSS